MISSPGFGNTIGSLMFINEADEATAGVTAATCVAAAAGVVEAAGVVAGADPRFAK